MSNTALDPVCGKTLNPQLAPFEVRTQDRSRYYFCSANCAALFKENPNTYSDPEFGGEDLEEAAGPTVTQPGWLANGAR